MSAEKYQDRVGFEQLKEQPFVLIESVPFRIKSIGAQKQFGDMIIKHGIAAAQRLVNHQHLSHYSNSLSTQREWAVELRTCWERRLAEMGPMKPTQVHIFDDGFEVIVGVITECEPTR